MQNPVDQNRKRKLRRSFKVDIVFVFCMLIVPTVAIITGYTYWQNKRSVLNVTEQNFRQISDTVMHKSTSYLEVPQLFSEVSTELLRDPLLPVELDSTLESYFIKLVHTKPQLSYVYFGTEEGSFLQGQRHGNAFRGRFIDRTHGTEATENINHYDKNLGFIGKEEIDKIVVYDPRVRPWYKAAKEEKQNVWTDLYLFSESRVPGITSASPVFREDGSLIGVIGADLKLDGLSQFIKETTVSENGTVFIIDEDFRFVAYEDPNAMIAIDGNNVRQLHPHELGINWITEAVRQYQDIGKENFSFESDGKNYLAYFRSFKKAFNRSWTVAIIAPEKDFIGPMQATLNHTLFLSLGILVVVIIAGLFFARQLSRPIEQLTDEVIKVQNFELTEPVRADSYIHEINVMQEAIQAMKSGLLAFQRYVPSTLVKQLIDSGEDVKIGGKDREMSLFFSDIEAFTSISETIPPKELLQNLSEYFDVMNQIIDRQKGTVDKYIGDAVMAFWGAPNSDDDHAIHACRAALRCQKELHKLNKRWKEEGKMPFNTRIGINTAYTVVGNMGSRERLNYSVIGDGVNLASRLEAVNKLYNTQIIISQYTYRYIQRDFICRPLDQIAVKGKNESVLIYELMGEKSDKEAQKLIPLANGYKEAYSMHMKRKWEAAATLLKTVRKQYPHDHATKFLLERCEGYIKTPPGDDWTGIVKLTNKL